MEVDVAPALRPRRGRVRDRPVPRPRPARPAKPSSAATLTRRVLRDYINRFHASGFVRGVRQVLHVPSLPPGTCLKDDIRERRPPTGQARPVLRPMHAARRISRWRRTLRPGARHALHPGPLRQRRPQGVLFRRAGEKPWHEADAWKRDMESLAKRPNVICKISGIVARARRNGPPIISPDRQSLPRFLRPAIASSLAAIGPYASFERR